MIKLVNVCKKYGNNTVLDNINFEIEQGEKIVLCGPSGQGKTTLLRLIAGLEKADSGVIENNHKNVSFAFQDNLLLENLNAFDNIAYGIDHRTCSKEDLKNRVLEVSTLFECTDYLYQKISTLSGGQKQRVSLARAFLKRPDLLLVDEAFNNLDSELKAHLLEIVVDIQQKTNCTLIYVSHDNRDIDSIGGHCVFVNDNKIKTKED